MSLSINLKKYPEIKHILCLFFSTRLVLTVVGIFSRTLIEGFSRAQYEGSRYLWLSIWGVWDTGWYMDIAANGYSFAETVPPLYEQQANWAFFPLYPMLMRILGTILGNRYYIAGIIISNVSLIAACFILYKLVRLDYSKKTALNSVKYLLLFPPAFILSGVFTESIYLALTLSCFYLAQKGDWKSIGILGFFLSLTRTLGVVIILPLLYEYFKDINFNLKKVKPDLLFLLLIPLGLSTFAIYNYYLTGDFLAFKNILSAPGWERSLANPFVILISGFNRGIYQGNMHDLFEACFTLFFFIVLLIGFRKMKFSYWLFGLYSMFIPLSTGLFSMPRYILPIFPFYILLAKFSKNPCVEEVTTIILGLIQGFLMVFWSSALGLVV